MLAREPEEVARFLAKTQGLNKTMIGEYLGEREDTCLKVMHAYVDAMDFSGAAFDQAIRCGMHNTFLGVWTFAQQVGGEVLAPCLAILRSEIFCELPPQSEVGHPAAMTL